jgi:hypothetical protein
MKGLFLIFALVPAFALGQLDALTTDTAPAQILVGDSTTTETLSGMRIILNSQLATLRTSVGTEVRFEQLSEELLDLQQTSALYTERLALLLPEHEKKILSNSSRVKSLIHNLNKDFRDGSSQQIQATYQLLFQTLQALFELNNQLDELRTLPPSFLNAQAPTDWVTPEFLVQGFIQQYQLQNGEQLIQAILERLRLLRSATFNRLEEQHEVSLQEVRELAIEMRSRRSELPIPSQQPFLNLCLQLEVIAENATSYYRENNRVALRTQVQEAMKVVDTAQAYYKARKATE